ncbi:MAG: DUF1573 domain-containing protein [Pedobacter sp.]|nr:MAG: DUF1573 domain-containing protein [Pedobacter sp.]
MNLLRTRYYVGCLLMCIGFSSCHSVSDQTKIVAKDNIDLGAFTIGDTANFTIPVVNPTDETLKILDIKGSCECITINTYPKELRPQQTGTINATYSSEFEGKFLGVLYKNVVIKLNKKPFIHSVRLKVDIK